MKERKNVEKMTPHRSEATDVTRAMGARIRRLREELGMTQGDLAAAVGYRDSTSVTFIEQGRNNLKADVLLLMCATLKTTPNELFGWEEEK